MEESPLLDKFVYIIAVFAEPVLNGYIYILIWPQNILILNVASLKTLIIVSYTQTAHSVYPVL